MYVVLIPLVGRCSWRYLKTLTNSLSVIAFMGRKGIIFLSYSYSTNSYLFTLFELNGNFSVMDVSICLLWLAILVNTALVCCARGGIGRYSCILYLGLLWFGVL